MFKLVGKGRARRTGSVVVAGLREERRGRSLIGYSTTGLGGVGWGVGVDPEGRERDGVPGRLPEAPLVIRDGSGVIDRGVGKVLLDDDLGFIVVPVKVELGCPAFDPCDPLATAPDAAFPGLATPTPLAFLVANLLTFLPGLNIPSPESLPGCRLAI